MKLYPNSILEKLGYQQIKQTVLELAQSAQTVEILKELKPSSNKSQIEKLLSQTSEMLEILSSPDPFPLHEFPDVRDYLTRSRAVGSIIPLPAFVDILRICNTSRQVKNFLKSKEEHYFQLYKLSQGLISLKDLEANIKGKVTEYGELRDDASTELRAIRKRLNSRKNDLRNTINRAMKNAVKDKMASDEGATIRNGRMVIPIQAEFKRKIEGFIHDVSATGQTVYLEP